MSIKDYYNKTTVYTIYEVSNITKAKQFYTEILQLPVSFEAPPEIGWIEIGLPVAGAYLALQLNQTDSIIPSTSLSLSCNNLEGLLTLLRENEQDISEITDVPDMFSYFSVSDPDENLISFIGPPRQRSNR